MTDKTVTVIANYQRVATFQRLYSNGNNKRRKLTLNPLSLLQLAPLRVLSKIIVMINTRVEKKPLRSIGRFERDLELRNNGGVLKV